MLSRIRIHATAGMWPAWLLACAVNSPSALAESPLVLGHPNFDSTIKGDRGDWVVVFCDGTAYDCNHMVESVGKLSTIWSHSGLYYDSHFAEVKCHQDKTLCNREGISHNPAAVRYRNGIRIASWRSDGHTRKASVVSQFIAWVKNELYLGKPEKAVASSRKEDKKDSVVWQLGEWLKGELGLNEEHAPSTPEVRGEDKKDSVVWQVGEWLKGELGLNEKHAPSTPEVVPGSAVGSRDKDATTAFSFLSPFANMDHANAAVGWCLVLGVIAIVVWVIIDGFEMWPAVMGKL